MNRVQSGQRAYVVLGKMDQHGARIHWHVKLCLVIEVISDTLATIKLADESGSRYQGGDYIDRRSIFPNQPDAEREAALRTMSDYGGLLALP